MNNVTKRMITNICSWKKLYRNKCVHFDVQAFDVLCQGEVQALPNSP